MTSPVCGPADNGAECRSSSLARVPARAPRRRVGAGPEEPRVSLRPPARATFVPAQATLVIVLSAKRRASIPWPPCCSTAVVTPQRAHPAARRPDDPMTLAYDFLWAPLPCLTFRPPSISPTISKPSPRSASAPVRARALPTSCARRSKKSGSRSCAKRSTSGLAEARRRSRGRVDAARVRGRGLGRSGASLASAQGRWPA